MDNNYVLNRLPAIFIMGATAAGKTDLAINIAKHFPCEIISVDSALIYKGLDIGTAKPSKQELAETPHFLVDIIEPESSYSAWDFKRDALQLMQQITARGHIPLLVGGTMLYFNALEFGMDELPASDQHLREQLELLRQSHGLAYLYEQLQQVDKASADKIKPNDKQRIMRALEVFKLTGKPLSQLQSQNKNSQLPYNLFKVILVPEDRQLLHHRIAQRFDSMLEQGFVNEVKQLKQKQLTLECPSMRCVGYRQVWEYLEDEYDYDTMRDKACAATRQLAKRQITWLRKQQNAHWFDSEARDDHQIFKLLNEFLT